MSSRIAVIGTGYVGLTTGACFAQLGHDVTCADIDAEKVAMLNEGRIPIHEEGLENIVREAVKEGRLRFVLGAANAVEGREFVYLCVPTPQLPDGSADLSYIQGAAAEIAPYLDRSAIVINKSTVPVGSTRRVEQALGRPDVTVVSNPEFLREGSAVNDFLNPDRVVIGADDQGAATRVASLFLGTRAPILVTDPASAETTKYASNAFLATKLSFVNAVAAVCEAVGADVNDVMLGIGYDRRIGHEFLRPGPGWGGSCFPKDTRAMISIAEEGGYDFTLLRGVIEVNDEQFDRVAAKILSAISGNVATSRVGVLGLTFKAGTDDVRESPSVEIARRLLAAGASVRGYDPAISSLPNDLGVNDVEVVDDPYAAAEGASVLVVLTEWDDFKWLDLDKLGETMAEKNIVDARNILDRGAVRRAGFSYQGIGRN
ncbi:MAG: UDP-glucose/GDP-mannose dehydrogenase family protein [Acidimicrobiia bacterium]|nr:UDP-glucose/GDP-mannose dehydrogenase family protein [Acidimicrobiia bacterium]MDH5237344.1 UDP-glucose/GDP-mannose dehydrogenase family protein [Acidimicrobiia bacterium]